MDKDYKVVVVRRKTLIVVHRHFDQMQEEVVVVVDKDFVGKVTAEVFVHMAMEEAFVHKVMEAFVHKVKLYPDHGYGFVSFDSAQSAQAAIAALNGMASADGTKHLEVTLKKESAREPKSKSKEGGSSSRFTPY